MKRVACWFDPEHKASIQRPSGYNSAEGTVDFEIRRILSLLANSSKVIIQ